VRKGYNCQGPVVVLLLLLLLLSEGDLKLQLPISFYVSPFCILRIYKQLLSLRMDNYDWRVADRALQI
jgi:hypothetical protein